jgi:hypothetical protein
LNAISSMKCAPNSMSGLPGDRKSSPSNNFPRL